MSEITANEMPPNTRFERIEQRLREIFAPTLLDLRDESHLHAGHNADARHGGTHFRLTMTGPAFDGLSRVAAQRLVNKALAAEFSSGLHALAITIA